MPTSIPSLLQRAGEALKERRIDDALILARQAQALLPDDQDCNFTLATIEARAGLVDSAIQRLQGLAERVPDRFDAHFWLSVLYRTRHEYEESLRHAHRAIEIRAGEGQLYSNLALTQMACQDFAAATRSFERAIQLSPRVAENYEMLGKTLWLQGRENQALDAYARAGRLAPHSLDTLLVLAQIAASQNRYEDASKLAHQVLAKDPGSSVAKLVLAGASVEAGLASSAQKQIRAILDAEPTNSTALVLAGMQQQALGKTAEAESAYRKSIALNPEQGLAYCSLVRAIKVTEDYRPFLHSMENLVRSERVNPRGKSFLHFGLGKAYDDLGEYRAAIEHFDQANKIAYRLKFGDGKFDRDRLTAYVDWTIETFTDEFLGQVNRTDPSTDRPIFIVGMMRSGTTLVEQILSSHPLVDAAGERSFWLIHSSEAMRPGTKKLDLSQLRNLAAQYFDELSRLFPAAKHITDKMPGNYRVLGMIAAAFPNAKIVHTKRNSMDTCLSIYMTPNRVANEFAHSRENIVFAYRAYQRLMAHWETVLGPERMITVEYEALVTNPNLTVRELVDFCGLPWSEQCLKPEANIRSVVTPSVWQVRQPVYTSSVDRWRNYEPWLGAFAELNAD